MALQCVIIVYSGEEARIKGNSTIIPGQPQINYGIRDTYSGQIAIVGDYKERDEKLDDCEKNHDEAVQLMVDALPGI